MAIKSEDLLLMINSQIALHNFHNHDNVMTLETIDEVSLIVEEGGEAPLTVGQQDLFFGVFNTILSNWHNSAAPWELDGDYEGIGLGDLVITKRSRDSKYVVWQLDDTGYDTIDSDFIHDTLQAAVDAAEATVIT